MQTTKQRVELLYKEFKNWSKLDNQTIIFMVLCFFAGYYGIVNLICSLVVAACAVGLIVLAKKAYDKVRGTQASIEEPVTSAPTATEE